MAGGLTSRDRHSFNRELIRTLHPFRHCKPNTAITENNYNRGICL